MIGGDELLGYHAIDADDTDSLENVGGDDLIIVKKRIRNEYEDEGETYSYDNIEIEVYKAGDVSKPQWDKWVDDDRFDTVHLGGADLFGVFADLAGKQRRGELR